MPHDTPISLVTRWRDWRRRRFLRRHGIAPAPWRTALAGSPVLQPLDTAERERLRELASRFLRLKTVSGAGGLEAGDDMRVFIAAQACLLILDLGLDYFGGWYEVIVYPGSFLVDREETDAAGVIRNARHSLRGEAWGRGPVILSWDDIRPGAAPYGRGTNVILHEFAHKLDMLNGAANGLPPLHRGMSRPAWTAAFAAAYGHLAEQARHYIPTAVDPYGAESPAEFFAVATAAFFETPRLLAQTYPEVYAQLRLFYRQDPLRRAG